MDHLVPWAAWFKKIESYYDKGEHGHKPCGLELML